MIKRISAMIIILMLLTGCAGNGQEGASPESVDSGVSAPEEKLPLTQVRLGRSPEDSLNPFTCLTQTNSYLSALLFEPLAALDTRYNIENRLAQEIRLSGNVCAVTLREGLLFSDGSALSAADVVYSIDIARASARYSAQLAGVISAEATAENVVTITLSSPDAFFDRSLTFPIVKVDTAQQELPVGAGRFVCDAGVDSFSRNLHYYGGSQTGIQTVLLVDIANEEGKTFAVMSGDVDMVYSDLRRGAQLGGGVIKSMVTLNDLVFMGINRAGFGFGEELMELFGWIMPRADIAAKAYSGYATATDYIINPAMDASSGGNAQRISAARIEERLASLGFGEIGEDGFRRLNGEDFMLNLIVGQRAQRRSAGAQIQEAFAYYGIRIEVQELTDEQFDARIAAGNYELYLGEIRLPDNMDISALLAPAGGAQEGSAPISAGGFSAGIVRDDELLAAYDELKRGECEVADFCAVFSSRPTVIPIVFRRGIVCRSKTFSADIVATQQDIFYNILDW